MAYFDVAQMAVNGDLQGRITACAATEGQDGAQYWMSQHIWDVVAAPGWGDAWASAMAADNPEPGRDPGVITDSQILTQVQAVRGAG